MDSAVVGSRPEGTVGRKTQLTAEEIMEIRAAHEQLRVARARLDRLRAVYGRGIVNRAMRPELYKWVRWGVGVASKEGK